MIKKYLVLGAIVAPFTFFDKVTILLSFLINLLLGSLSANVSYYTNYIWRGEEQTGGLSNTRWVRLLGLSC